MANEGVIGSDSTTNEFDEYIPDGINLVSVAVAVDDVDSFVDDYFEITSAKVDQYGMKVQSPILKDKFISRWVPDWQQQDARRDIVISLLGIESIDTIQVTETYLRPRWLECYFDDPGPNKRMKARDFVSKDLHLYYNIVSVWKYLNEYEGGPDTHYNVVTDDCEGEVSEAWEEIGEWSDRLRVIPNGDRTHPVLSLADLLTGLLKQEVYPMKANELRSYLIETDTAGYVNADSINNGSDLRKVTPRLSEHIRTDLHYPDPTVYIKRDKVPKTKIKSFDLFDYACMYAYMEGGCVKFFDENNDRHHLSSDDIIVCMRDVGNVESYRDMNDSTSVNVLAAQDAMSKFKSRIPEDLLMSAE